MTSAALRKICLSLPHATEQVQWGNDLVFKIGGKMFAVAALEPDKHCLLFKCSPEEFAELTERNGIIPAPYLARSHWVALESLDALSACELQQRIKRSYTLVLERLPKKTQAELA